MGNYGVDGVDGVDGVSGSGQEDAIEQYEQYTKSAAADTAWLKDVFSKKTPTSPNGEVSMFMVAAIMYVMNKYTSDESGKMAAIQSGFQYTMADVSKLQSDFDSCSPDSHSPAISPDQFIEDLANFQKNFYGKGSSINDASPFMQELYKQDPAEYNSAVQQIQNAIAGIGNPNDYTADTLTKIWEHYAANTSDPGYKTVTDMLTNLTNTAKGDNSSAAAQLKVQTSLATSSEGSLNNMYKAMSKMDNQSVNNQKTN